MSSARDIPLPFSTRGKALPKASKNGRKPGFSGPFFHPLFLVWQDRFC
jgi:hypothetical protein